MVRKRFRLARAWLSTWIWEWDARGLHVGVNLIERGDLMTQRSDEGRYRLVGFAATFTLARRAEFIEDHADWRRGWFMRWRYRSDAREIALRLAGGPE